MSVALIEPFDRWFLSLSKGSGTTCRNECYAKCGGFDKLNHRNANLLDSPFFYSKIKSVTWASQAFIKSAGERHSCWPRTPALMFTVSISRID